MVMLSGLKPYFVQPNHSPVRPKPVITSSSISEMAYLSSTRADRIEIALRRQDHAARALNRLGDHRRDRGGILAQDQRFEIGRHAGGEAFSLSPSSAS